jgi:hypothetical protein
MGCNALWSTVSDELEFQEAVIGPHWAISAQGSPVWQNALIQYRKPDNGLDNILVMTVMYAAMTHADGYYRIAPVSLHF